MSSPVPTASGFTVVTQVYPPQSGAAAPASFTAPAVSSPLEKFLKGEPKALGVVQIMIGTINILFGIVMAQYADSIGVFSGIVFWGGLFYITSGSLAVAAAKNMNICLVRGSLGMNIMSSITAGIAIIIFSLDVALRIGHFYCQHYDCVQVEYVYETVSDGVKGVLLVFSVLVFIISIIISAFACKAVCDCSTEPVVYVPHPSNQLASVAPGNLIPAPSTHGMPVPQFSGQSAMGNKQTERPPAYNEVNEVTN